MALYHENNGGVKAASARQDDDAPDPAATDEPVVDGAHEGVVPKCRQRSVRLKHNLLPLARPLRDRSGGAR